MANTETRTRAVELALAKDQSAEKPVPIKRLLENANKIANFIDDGSLPAAGTRPGGDVEAE